MGGGKGVGAWAGRGEGGGGGRRMSSTGGFWDLARRSGDCGGNDTVSKASKMDNKKTRRLGGSSSNRTAGK